MYLFRLLQATEKIKRQSLGRDSFLARGKSKRYHTNAILLAIFFAKFVPFPTDYETMSSHISEDGYVTDE